MDANFNSFEVYRQCSRRGWTALIGDKRSTFPHKSAKGRKLERFYSARNRVAVGKNGCNLHRFSTLNVKDCLSRLRRNQDPAQGPTWEIADDVPEEYIAQLDAEQRIRKNDKWIWEQIRNAPNHYFDCETMQVCGALMLKLIGQESGTLGKRDGGSVDEDAAEFEA